MGSAPDVPVLYGPPVHPEVATRWTAILMGGLKDEEVNLLLKTYPAPENCSLIVPPKVNVEIAKAARDFPLQLDAKKVRHQNQVGAALTAISRILTDFCKEGVSEQTWSSYIRYLRDAARLLADVHHSETVLRQGLLSEDFNSELRDMLNSSVHDEWLFGRDLNERLQASKALDKVSSELKPSAQPSTSAAPAGSSNSNRPTGNHPKKTQFGVSIQEQTEQMQSQIQRQSERRTGQQEERPRLRQKIISPPIAPYVCPHAGRLQYFYHKWSLITTDASILSWTRGLELPLT